MDGNSFYTSKAWRGVRERKIADSGGVCARCGRVFTDTSKLIVHHKRHLKNNDYNNPEVAFADDNLEVICFNCHNEEHDRFKNIKHVYVVFGPPLSGKSTFVRENKEKDDIVVDMDRLYMAITGNDMYDKPDTLRYNVFMLHDCLLDQIKTRYPKNGGWRNAWIIGGYANAWDRDALCKRVNADECILMETSMDECLMRLETCTDVRQTKKTLWEKYIRDWFSNYIPPKKSEKIF